MHESELADPYMTPRTLPVRRPFMYLAYGIILAVVLLTFAAGSLMAWWAIRPSRVILDRGPEVPRGNQLINQRRGPVRPMLEQSISSPESAVP